ncbi:efflux RND transporter periplasmic adaptor subunit [Paenibacillus segetis]|uniref:RND transporter n=1 Tax=Paenibacillus segetis TaxID=1325360 RepID=A0ABQ1YCP2_9BACL|nr:biotin/lipoyl-binding protein [Paenibacillus segetis]GGH19624.1 RND transporter [Paenibacillus segetis]
MELELGEVPKGSGRKRKVQFYLIIFIVLLVFFTLFSNTFQSFTLPKVRTEKAEYGSIIHTLGGNGVLLPIAEAKLSNPDHWKVRTILVKEGDRVKKGQKLITYDSTTAERELQDEVAYLKKQKIDLQNIQDRYITSTIDGDEMGIRKAGRDLETSKLDLGVQERKVNALKERLASQKEISAPFNGVITKLIAIEGMQSTGEPEIVISNDSEGYRFEFLFDALLMPSFGISMGEKIQVEVRGIVDQQTTIMEGTIAEIVDAESRMENMSDNEANKTLLIAQKILRVKVMDSKLKGGEQAFVKLTKNSSQEGMVISNKAIHLERDGKFIYKIEEQMGALGNAFIVRKVQIELSETNDNETVVLSGGLNEDDLIILEYSEPLQEGNRVRLK